MHVTQSHSWSAFEVGLIRAVHCGLVHLAGGVVRTRMQDDSRARFRFSQCPQVGVNVQFLGFSVIVLECLALKPKGREDLMVIRLSWLGDQYLRLR